LKDSNQFYTLTKTSKQIGVIAGSAAALSLVKESSTSVNIMLYKEQWEDDNYYNPRKALISMLQSRSGGGGTKVIVLNQCAIC
jgi:hypothetical protein